jgi:hypothetical protein
VARRNDENVVVTALLFAASYEIPQQPTCERISVYSVSQTGRLCSSGNLSLSLSMLALGHIALGC